MKSLKFSIPALALILGLSFSAFTTATKAITPTKASLNWYTYDASTTKLTVFLGLEDRSTAISTNCPDAAGTQCARGYNAPQPLNVAGAGNGQDNIQKNP